MGGERCCNPSWPPCSSRRCLSARPNPQAEGSGRHARIKIDVLREIGEVDPNLYGVFMEPIRSSMDGLLYDPDHPLANQDGFRTDYIEAAHELQLTNMRWPGGKYMASYDWKDGIGPKQDRPVRRELAWGVLERNHVGTDEWPATSTLRADGRSFRYAFAPHSFTQIRVRVE